MQRLAGGHGVSLPLLAGRGRTVASCLPGLSEPAFVGDTNEDVCKCGKSSQKMCLPHTRPRKPLGNVPLD